MIYSNMDLKPLGQASIGLTVAAVYTVPPSTTALIKEINIAHRGMIANPAAAPTLSASTTGGSITTGTVYVKYSFVDSLGNETAASAEASVPVTGPTASVSLTNITTLPLGAVGIKVYVASTTGAEKYSGQSATGSGAYTITTIPGAGAVPPASNATGQTGPVTVWLFNVPTGSVPDFANVKLKWNLSDGDLFVDTYSTVLKAGATIQVLATGRGCTIELSGVEFT